MSAAKAQKVPPKEYTALVTSSCVMLPASYTRFWQVRSSLPSNKSWNSGYFWASVLKQKMGRPWSKECFWNTGAPRKVIKKGKT